MYGKTENNKFEDFQSDNSSHTHATLDEVVEWIGDNLEADDVFDDKKIANAAQKFSPGDIFETSALNEWALENGFEFSKEGA